MNVTQRIINIVLNVTSIQKVFLVYIRAVGNDRGQRHEPELTLSVLNSAGDPLGDSPVVTSGDYIRFAIGLTLTGS